MKIIVQMIGFVALAISLMAFQKNKRTQILYIQMTACILFSFHYLLLGAFTGAAINILVALRNYVFANKSLKTWADNKIWLYIFILVFTITSALSWQGFITLLLLFTVILGTIIFWLNNTKYIRLLSLISPPIWFVYNFIMKSYPGMIGETLTFLSIVIGIIRFDIVENLNKNINCSNKK